MPSPSFAICTISPLYRINLLLISLFVMVFVIVVVWLVVFAIFIIMNICWCLQLVVNSIPLEESTAFMCHNLRLLFRIKEGLWISSDSFGGCKRTLLASKRFRNTFRYLRADQHPRSWRRIWESPDFYLVMCIRLCLARPI